MAIIKHISVYDGSSWNTYSIGAEAANISYNNDGTIYSLNNFLNGLNTDVSGLKTDVDTLKGQIGSIQGGKVATVHTSEEDASSSATGAYIDSYISNDTSTPSKYWRMSVESGTDITSRLYATDDGIGLQNKSNNDIWFLSKNSIDGLNSDLTTLNTKVNTIQNDIITSASKSSNGKDLILTRSSGNITVKNIDTTYTGTTPIAVSTANVISHANSGVTAKTYGTNNTNTINLSNGSTFSVPGFAVNGTGHITSANAHTVKLALSNATTSVAGLMTAADKKKLNNLKLATTIVNAQRSSSFSLGANAGTSGSFSYSAPSGYTFIGMNSYNTGDPMIHFATLVAESGKITYYVKNQHTSMTKPCRPSVGCVFMKLTS